MACDIGPKGTIALCYVQAVKLPPCFI